MDMEKNNIEVLSNIELAILTSDPKLIADLSPVEEGKYNNYSLINTATLYFIYIIMCQLCYQKINSNIFIF